jgi:DNA-binding transcriptional regulator YdaS (Cro superfamily)
MNLQNYKKAISIAGSQVKLAEKMQTRVGTVGIWVQRGIVPPERVIDVCAAINYQVTPHEIRPDIYPHPDDALPSAMRCHCGDRQDL